MLFHRLLLRRPLLLDLLLLRGALLLGLQGLLLLGGALLLHQLLLRGSLLLNGLLLSGALLLDLLLLFRRAALRLNGLLLLLRAQLLSLLGPLLLHLLLLLGGAPLGFHCLLLVLQLLGAELLLLLLLGALALHHVLLRSIRRVGRPAGEGGRAIAGLHAGIALHALRAFDILLLHAVSLRAALIVQHLLLGRDLRVARHRFTAHLIQPHGALLLQLLHLLAIHVGLVEAGLPQFAPLARLKHIQQGGGGRVGAAHVAIIGDVLTDDRPLVRVEPALVARRRPVTVAQRDGGREDSQLAIAVEHVVAIFDEDDIARVEAVADAAIIHVVVEPTIDVVAVIPARLVIVRRGGEKDVGLRNRRHIDREVLLAHIAVLDEDPAFGDRRRIIVGPADGIAGTVRRDRRPAGTSATAPPGHPRRRPGVAGDPEPAIGRVIAPATVMIGRPAERLVGFPVPAILVGPDPAAFLIGAPIRPDIRGNEHVLIVGVLHPGAVLAELVVEHVDVERRIRLRHIIGRPVLRRGRQHGAGGEKARGQARDEHWAIKTKHGRHLVRSAVGTFNVHT